MISESASEHSNMSLSPPITKSTKLGTVIRPHHNKTIKKEQEELSERPPVDHKRHHLVSTTHSKAKKKSKSKSSSVQRNNDDDEEEEEEGDDDDDDDDEGHFVDRTRNNQLMEPVNNDHQSSEHHSLSNKVNKNKSNKNEANKQQKISKDVELIISHKNKCPNSGSINNSATNPLKKIKKEKKRYQELVIDGFTITAFRTWEDLQDEMNERISANIKRNAQTADDSDMPNTSCSSSAASSLTATEATFHSTQTNNATTSLLQPKQSSSSSGVAVASCNFTSEASKRNLISQSNDSDRQDHVDQDHRQELSGSNVNGHRSDKRSSDRLDRRAGYGDHLSLLHKTLRQNSDHELRQQYHDQPQSREEYHKTIRLQSSTRENPSGETRQHQSNPSVNNNYSCGADPIHEQYRSSRPNDADLERSRKPQLEPQRTSHAGQSAIPSNYPRRSPSPTHLHPPPSSSQTAHQYLQQYQQLYQQMHNSSQHHQHHNQQQQPPPHLQNPYLAFMNQFPHGSHLKGSGPPPPSLPPAPPPPLPMPNPGHMMAPSPFNSPYTITDTIISRQTSIIPSTALPPMPGSLEHLANSRYGRHPHLSALEHTMAAPVFGQHQNASSYMPSPTERSFMEFARSYANASNMSSGYNSFMSHAAVPKSTMGPSNFYGHLERMTMDHQHRAMVQGFGAGGPNPFTGFSPASRPPTISMFPPHYYP